jgi:CRP-like cAMP-binding protein
MQTATTFGSDQTISQVFTDASLGARPASVEAGTVLYEPHDAAENVHFIHRGQVRLYQVGPDGSQRLVEILGAEEWFGIAALAKAGQYGVRAVVVTNSVITEVNSAKLMDSLTHRPQHLVELTQQLASKVQAAHDDAACLIFEDCNERLIKTLIRFSDSAAATRQEDGVVLRITHNQLAQAVGVARETVSLALTQLRHQNVLRTGRNQLFFSPEVLRKFVNRNANGNGQTNGNGAEHRETQVA